MAKYRKKPVVIDAVQYLGDISVHTALLCEPQAGARPYIHTLEGKMSVNYGDWIITGIQGEAYPCKPDIFTATYEAVDV